MIASMHRCLEVAYLITACEHISYCVQSKTVQQELHEKTRKVTLLTVCFTQNSFHFLMTAAYFIHSLPSLSIWTQTAAAVAVLMT